MRRIAPFLFAAMIVAAALLIVWDLSHRKSVPPVTSKEGDDRTGEVETVYAPGIVEGAHGNLALRFEITGRIQEILLREGDRVREGEVLARLDPSLWQQKLAEAQVRLKLARTARDRVTKVAQRAAWSGPTHRVVVAETRGQEPDGRSLNRKHQLQRNPLASGEPDHIEEAPDHSSATTAKGGSVEVDSATGHEELSLAELQVAVAEEAVREGRLMLDKTLLRSPVSGIVLELPGQIGELTGPADERPPVTVVNRDRTMIRAFVEEYDALSVDVGMPARVTTDSRPGNRYQGTVRSCAPSLHPKSRRHRKPGELLDVQVREVLIELDAGEDLLVGLPVDVFIQPPQAAASSIKTGSAARSR